MEFVTTFFSAIPSQAYFATAGGFAVKFLELAELHSVAKEHRPSLGEGLYWVNFFVIPLLGGALGYVYFSSDMILKPIIAVNVGISAPLIIRAMAASGPKQVKVPDGA